MFKFDSLKSAMGLKLNVVASRGDSDMREFLLHGNDIPDSGITALVTLKKTLNSAAIWQKRIPVINQRFNVVFSSEDTNLAVGKYYWDIRLLFDDGSVTTPLDVSSFKIVDVVGVIGDG